MRTDKSRKKVRRDLQQTTRFTWNFKKLVGARPADTLAGFFDLCCVAWTEHSRTPSKLYPVFQHDVLAPPWWWEHEKQTFFKSDLSRPKPSVFSMFIVVYHLTARLANDCVIKCTKEFLLAFVSYAYAIFGEPISAVASNLFTNPLGRQCLCVFSHLIPHKPSAFGACRNSH